MSETEAEALGKKGRPTPSRKDAQAAAKERARAGMDKKAVTKLLREKRTDSNKKMREGMKAGDEKYLPKRDQGPVKRYVRDWVDSRLTFSEFLLPLLVVIMIGSASKNGSPVQRVTSYLWTASILLLLIDTVVLRFRLRKALLAKFPDEDLRGTTFYAYVRTLQIRFMRMPKPKVKFGGSPK
ncbi:MAG: rane protein [Marmoricola sp.]|nr:rane protein [Marmoricola sp.]